MQWLHEPYVGVGPVRFGMTPSDVAAVLGAPEDVQGEISGEAGFEFRLRDRWEDALPTVQYTRGLVSGVELYEQNDTLVVAGLQVFKMPKRDVNDALLGLSQHYAMSTDSLVLLDLGVSLSRDDTWEYAPSLHVFARGEFDDVIARGVADGVTRVIHSRPPA